MRLRIDTKQAEKLAKEFGVSAKELKAGQRIAFREALQQIQKRARAEHRFRSRSGLAEKSIDVDESNLGQLEGAVFLDEGVAPYAPFLHEGTKRHFVGPKDKKALRWVAGGGFG